MTEKEKSIYMAGFFDGEGYVGLYKRKRSENFIEFLIQVSIGQKDGETMDWIKENFGGYIHLVKRDGSYHWIVSNNAAYRFLKRITPFLKYKKIQAELALDFFEGRTGGKKVTPKERSRREVIHQKLQQEKKVFKKSKLCISAATTTKRIDIRKDDVIV